MKTAVKVVVEAPSEKDLRDKIWFFTKLFGRKPEITASLSVQMPFGTEAVVDKVFGSKIYVGDTKINFTDVKSVVLS